VIHSFTHTHERRHLQLGVLEVKWTDRALLQLQNCCGHKKGETILEHFQNADQVRAAASQSISLDPRTLNSKRKRHELFAFTIDVLDIVFRIPSDTEAEVVKVSMAAASKPSSREESTGRRTYGLRTKEWLEDVQKELAAERSTNDKTKER